MDQSDCLSKTQVDANSKEEVCQLTLVRCGYRNLFPGKGDSELPINDSPKLEGSKVAKFLGH